MNVAEIEKKKEKWNRKKKKTIVIFLRRDKWNS